MRLMLCVALLAVSFVTSASAGFQFEIVTNGPYTASASPINDFFDVYLRVTDGDVGSSITDYGINYQLTSNPGGALTLGTPTHSGGLFPSTNFSPVGSTSSIAAFGNSGAATPLGNFVFLGRVPFTIAANESGTYVFDEYNPLPNPLRLSQIVLSGNVEPPFTVLSGSIVVNGINAVPEPATMGLFGLAIAGGAGLIRRRLSRKTA